MIRLEPAAEMDEATRAALASGRADPAIALFLDCLMEIRGISGSADGVISGAGLETEAPADMAADALERTFAAIDAGEGAADRRASPAKRRYPELIRLPQAAHDAILAAEGAKGWRKATAGIAILPLATASEVQAQLMRISPGAAAPRHSHMGRELTLCLVGGFSDHRGSYGPGDVAVADPEVTHQPRADADGPCVVLTIKDGALVFDGVLGLMQKLFGCGGVVAGRHHHDPGAPASG